MFNRSIIPTPYLGHSYCNCMSTTISHLRSSEHSGPDISAPLINSVCRRRIESSLKLYSGLKRAELFCVVVRPKQNPTLHSLVFIALVNKSQGFANIIGDYSPRNSHLQCAPYQRQGENGYNPVNLDKYFLLSRCSAPKYGCCCLAGSDCSSRWVGTLKLRPEINYHKV